MGVARGMYGLGQMEGPLFLQEGVVKLGVLIVCCYLTTHLIVLDQVLLAAQQIRENHKCALIRAATAYEWQARVA